MRILIILLLCFISNYLYSQNDIIFNEPLKIVAVDEVDGEFEIEKGSILTATAISRIYNSKTLKLDAVGILANNIDSKQISIDVINLNHFAFKEIDNVDKVWSKNLLKSGTYANLFTKGFQFKIRDEFNNSALEYVNILNKNDRFFDDKYFEDYLYTLINKIHYGILKDKRPGNIFVKVLKDTEPNAFVLSNGCVVVTTGLLSTIQSEDELVGILSHEIAHFVLDHHILNYNKEIENAKNAETWTAFATTLAAATDIYLGIKNKNHLPGVLTATTAIVASTITDKIRLNLGIKYSQEQELEADIVAKEILEVLKYDKLGLSVALHRIKNYCIITGNYFALTGSGTHPTLNVRIGILGKVNNIELFTQPAFLKKVSLITSYNAWIELWNFSHHVAANELANRNISNGVATEADYIVKAVVERRLSNTKVSNEKVINLLNKAKSLNITPYIGLYKEEGITYLRLENTIEAKKSFQTYLKLLNEVKELKEKKLENIEVFDDEIEWTKKMIFKSDNL